MEKHNLRVTKGLSEALQVMDDKRRGKFIDILLTYQEEGKVYIGNDMVLKVGFAMAKAEIDRRNMNSLNGRMGGLKTAEKRRTVVAVQVRNPMECKTGMELLSKALGGK